MNKLLDQWIGEWMAACESRSPNTAALAALRGRITDARAMLAKMPPRWQIYYLGIGIDRPLATAEDRMRAAAAIIREVEGWRVSPHADPRWSPPFACRLRDAGDLLEAKR